MRLHLDASLLITASLTVQRLQLNCDQQRSSADELQLLLLLQRLRRTADSSCAWVYWVLIRFHGFAPTEQLFAMNNSL